MIKKFLTLAVCCFTFFAGLDSPLMASADAIIPSTMMPELVEVFPLEEKDGYVVLSETILLGEKVILEKGTLLLNLHAPVLKSHKDVRVYEGKDRLQDSYSRGRGIRDNQTSTSPQERAAIKRATETEWYEKAIFLEALRFASRNPLFLSYVDPQTKTVESVPLQLFEGMFLAEKNERIIVVSLDSEGRAAQAGFRTGDEIISLNEIPFKKSLVSLVEEYTSQKKLSGTRQAEMVFGISRGGETVSVKLKAPLSLNSSFF